MALVETCFLWFVFYSVIGGIYETLLCSIEQKRFINRGFLNGPYCPIYGCGAILNILILGEIQDPLLLFPAAVLLTGVLEYLTSWGMEELFHARWWDYSEKRFNINGRVCLAGAIAFGAFSLVQIKYLHPPISSYIAMIPDNMRFVISLTLFTLLFIDTVYTITKFSELEEVLQDAADLIDDAVQSVKTLYEKASTSYHGTFRKINSQIRRMLFSFPRLKSMRYNERLKMLRELIKIEKDGDKQS